MVEFREESLIRSLEFEENLFRNIKEVDNSLLKGYQEELNPNVNTLVNIFTRLNLGNSI